MIGAAPCAGGAGRRRGGHRRRDHRHTGWRASTKPYALAVQASVIAIPANGALPPPSSTRGCAQPAEDGCSCSTTTTCLSAARSPRRSPKPWTRRRRHRRDRDALWVATGAINWPESPSTGSGVPFDLGIGTPVGEQRAGLRRGLRGLRRRRAPPMAMLEAIGGFDESFRFGFEDVHQSWRAQMQAGARCLRPPPWPSTPTAAPSLPARPSAPTRLDSTASACSPNTCRPGICADMLRHDHLRRCLRAYAAARQRTLPPLSGGSGATRVADRPPARPGPAPPGRPRAGRGAAGGAATARRLVERRRRGRRTDGAASRLTGSAGASGAVGGRAVAPASRPRSSSSPAPNDPD